MNTFVAVMFLLGVFAAGFTCGVLVFWYALNTWGR